MATKIRLKRMGKKFYAFYRVVIMDSRTKRDGRAIEEIGTYNPNTQPSTININSERAQYWLGVGAQPTEQVLNLLNEMKKSRGLTYLFIAHDLSVVRFISDRIAVISKGRIVELAEAEELFLHPLHPYTKALLSAVPIPDPSLEKHKKLLVYDPSIHDYSVDKPVWEEIANGHFVYGNQRELEGYRKEYESQL